MSPKEREYYRERALIERERAATASSIAAEIHLELAFLYEKLAELEQDNGQDKPKLSIVA